MVCILTSAGTTAAQLLFGQWWPAIDEIGTSTMALKTVKAVWDQAFRLAFTNDGRHIQPVESARIHRIRNKAD